MLELIAGSILLSIIHAAIPNHWIPVVMIGRAEKWSKKELITYEKDDGAKNVNDYLK